MRVKRVGGLVLAALLLCVLSASTGVAQTRPTVAVIDFEFGTIQHWWSGNWDIGKGIADLLVDEFVNEGSFRMIERKRLDAILEEQNFSNSDRADPSAAQMAAIGKALGVQYLVVGSITKFGMETSEKRVGGGILGRSRFGIGDVGKSKGKANVALTARVIDTTTGEILISAKGDGTSSRSGLLLGGGGGGALSAVGHIDMSSSDFRDTILGEATEEAVQALIKNIIARKANLSR